MSCIDDSGGAEEEEKKYKLITRTKIFIRAETRWQVNFSLKPRRLIIQWIRYGRSMVVEETCLSCLFVRPSVHKWVGLFLRPQKDYYTILFAFAEQQQQQQQEETTASLIEKSDERSFQINGQQTVES